VDIEIKEGITLVTAYVDGDYVVIHTKEQTLNEIMIYIKNFLIASGFSKKSIDEYIITE